MKSLKELCENIIYKKCSEPVNCGCNWLNCGFQCKIIPRIRDEIILVL